MRRFTTFRPAVVVVVLLSCLSFSQSKQAPAAQKSQAVLWQDPGDIKSRDLFYGPGGKKGQPHGEVKFLKEDMDGRNPKFDVEDEDGKKWKAKVGAEAQPEPVASRLLWAVGYFSNENYFVADLKVDNMPSHLRRGQQFVSSPGHVSHARLQRHPPHEKKDDNWNWKKNPFVGTREFNGLRVMMALISNWDLKDENNAIFTGDSNDQQEYAVTDVGTAFGTPGKRYLDRASKNNLSGYRHAKFISKTTPDYVDFNFPRMPPLVWILDVPFYMQEFHNRWIGKHIPRNDAKWIGSLLAQLTPEQIHDAFRAGGYSQEQVEAFSAVLEKRIQELNRL